MQRNTPILRKKPLRRSEKRIRSATPKRAAQLREYSKRRLAYLNAHPVCEVWCQEHNVMWVSPGLYQDCKPLTSGTVWVKELIALGAPRATEIHHVAKRRGAMLLDETHWLAVCRANHERIEGNKKWARSVGYLLNF